MKNLPMNRWVLAVAMMASSTSLSHVTAFSAVSLRRPLPLASSGHRATATENAEDRQRRRRKAQGMTMSNRRKTKQRLVDSTSASSTTLLWDDGDDDLVPSSTPPSYRTKRRSAMATDGPLTKTPRDQFFPQYAMMQHDILTRAQEIELGRQVKRAQELQNQMQEFILTRAATQQQQPYTSQSSSSSQQQQKSFLESYEEWNENDMTRRTSSLLSTTSSKQSKRKKGPVRWNDHIDYSTLTEQDIVQHLGVPGGREELRQTLRQGAMARQTLISSNVRLVVSIAKQWFRRGGGGSGSMSNTATIASTAQTSSSALDYAWSRPNLDEVVQEGILGLVKAVERYDSTFELRFGTYATHWITSFIRRCFQEHATGCLKVPSHYHQLVQQYKKGVKRHYDLYNTAPTLDDMARELQVSPRRLRTILACTQPLVSLDAPRKRASMGGGKAGSDIKGKVEDDGDVLLDGLPCPEPRPEEQVEVSLLRQCLEHAMSTELSPHERDVVRLRLGLDDGVSRTVRQVAAMLYGKDAIHMSEIRAAEQRALKKLRSPYSLHTHKLLRYLDSSEMMNYQL